jgi:hypothetical protein
MAGEGARGFRDFSRLPPAQETREQPADPFQPGLDGADRAEHRSSKLRGNLHGNGHKKEL